MVSEQGTLRNTNSRMSLLNVHLIHNEVDRESTRNTYTKNLAGIIFEAPGRNGSVGKLGMKNR